MTPIFRECECGCDLFVIRQSITGYIHHYVSSYGEEADNSEMYEGTRVKDCWKYYRCNRCGRRAVEMV